MKTFQLKQPISSNFCISSAHKYCYWNFEDTLEFASMAAKDTSGNHPDFVTSHISGHIRQGWFQTESKEEAVELAKFGWPKGLEACKNILKDFKVSFDDILPKQDLAKKLQFGQEGEIFYPEKFFSGDPEHMGKHTEDPETKIKGNRFQRIVIEGSKAWHVNQDTIFQAGVIYSGLINALEMHGFQCEVLLRYSLKDSAVKNLTFVCDIMLKTFNEYLDENKMIFFIAHPSSFRRLCFSIIEQCPKHILLRLSSCYGTVVEYNNDLLQTYGDDGTIFLPSLTYDMPKEAILKIIREVVNNKFNPKETSFSE